MSDTENNTENNVDNQDQPFRSDYEDNKDSSAAEPMAVDQSLVTPDHDGVNVDDSAEPDDADVQHKVSAADVEKSSDTESSA